MSGNGSGVRVWRFEVRPSDAGGDPDARRVMADARASLGIEPEKVRTARCYLVQAAIDEGEAERLLRELLVDPVLERGMIGRRDDGRGGDVAGWRCVEVWPLPGVMDPAAITVERAARALLGLKSGEPMRVMTGRRYELGGVSAEQAGVIASSLLANSVIERTETSAWSPDALASTGPADQTVRTVSMRELDDAGLEELSRSGHLFLNLEEMRAIRGYFRDLGREPTDIELETLAQTWSEHCVHKTLKASVRYVPPENDHVDWRGRAGHAVGPDGSVRIENLLKQTIAAATHTLIGDGVDWTLSVFVDNSGVVRFDDAHAVCIKVETHNRPSAIEPYGGAATGVGGCIRDIIGTGLGAKPIANTDVFCVADPGAWRPRSAGDDDARMALPPGVLHPRRILTRVVDGVRDYGNRMGIPTVHGSVVFDDRYIGNPLVYCGCVGVMPVGLVEGDARPGDRIIALGGRTGKDGIHGATFSSGELTHTHADEFAHAVQIGNPIEEKRVLDAIMRARVAEGGPLYSAMTDCGAGGFSSAVGEMGEKIGAAVDLDRALLKYEGLRYDEVWISESQERMVLAVPAEQLERLRTICDEEGVELCDLGVFGHASEDGAAELLLKWEGAEVGSISMAFLHDGVPMPVREAVSEPLGARAGTLREADSWSGWESRVLGTLAEPNVASKRWIVRQYDHEVQGNTVGKPLVGPWGEGPADAAVLRPVPGVDRGITISSGLATGVWERTGDAYLMAVAAVDECVRNLVCAGADPERIAILDNFSWPSCSKPEHMGALVRACAGCHDAAIAYRAPFVSGKDSLNNQFRYTDAHGVEQLVEIPYTLLITGLGIVQGMERVTTSDAKAVESVLVMAGGVAAGEALVRGPGIARRVAGVIAGGHVLAAHDVSDGGVLTAVSEMVIGSGGAVVAELDAVAIDEPFGEGAAGYVLQVASDAADVVLEQLGGEGRAIGGVRPAENGAAGLAVRRGPDVGWVGFERLRDAFHSTLDW